MGSTRANVLAVIALAACGLLAWKVWYPGAIRHIPCGAALLQFYPSHNSYCRHKTASQLRKLTLCQCNSLSL